MPAETPRHFFFLRGLVRESGHWGEFLNLFAQAFPNDKLYLLDYPGNGRHWRLKSPWRLDGAIPFLREEAGREGLGDNAYLVTLSLGGMVGLSWVHAYPEDFRGLVLMNTSAANLSTPQERIRPQAWQKLIQIFLAANPQRREQKILELTSNGPRDRWSLVHSWVQLYRWHPIQRENALRQLVAAASFKIFDAKPQPPILMLRSLEDHLVDPRCSQLIAERWQLPLLTHPTAGHDLPLDAPDWVISQIKEWIEQLRMPAT